jgi:hypothetical protein
MQQRVGVIITRSMKKNKLLFHAKFFAKFKNAIMSLFDTIMSSARYKEAVQHQEKPLSFRGRMWYKQLRDTKGTSLLYILRLPYGQEYGAANVKSMNFTGLELQPVLDWWNGSNDGNIQDLFPGLSVDEREFLLSGSGGDTMDF